MVVTVPSGSSATVSLDTLRVGAPGNVAFSASGAPAGVDVTFSASPISAGSSAKMSIRTSSSVVPGIYPVTVTGTEDSMTHTVVVTLQVNPNTTVSAIKNGGFESGDFDGWVVSGETSIATAGCKSGNSCARLGGLVSKLGDSSASQTFIVSARKKKLKLSLRTRCIATAASAWSTVTLQDKAAKKPKILLAKTCTNKGTAVDLSNAVTAGHTYKLTVINHDDGKSASANVTYLDDIVVD